MSIVRLREASCLALVVLSYCLFPVVQLLTPYALNCLFPGVRRWGSGLLQRPSFQCAISQVNLYALKVLPGLAQVRGCPECRAPGGCWMALSPLSKRMRRVTSHLAADTATKTFWIQATALHWLEASSCYLAGHLHDCSSGCSPLPLLLEGAAE